MAKFIRRKCTGIRVIFEGGDIPDILIDHPEGMDYEVHYETMQGVYGEPGREFKTHTLKVFGKSEPMKDGGWD